ncbi:metallophosphoesterase [Chimaeribacter arupi]|uniref:metallophosphoesterase n=1 Tax=Chimaeribacter arupi TaxID=2060066 RepID=UPI000C79C6FD|nr:metallophosphoesterase [Chimaeribacter arupi]PLR32981.1 metallophosphoesterase [Chimaeribacter arupi]PLR44802.1 metallophosphoesterase [Chimaeribacter arupi]PLR49444.1 metallophosphoesterase [Chimaeribacter arupi]
MIIAQVSDIHAAPDNDNLSRLARALSWLDFIKPDALVLTGDVIDNNWSEGYEKVSACVHNRTWPTFVLPGNADDSTGIRAMSGRRAGSPATADDALHFVAELSGIRLIGLDSTLPGSPAGSVSEHLRWLEHTLHTGGVTPSILFLHHHVFHSGIPTLDQIMCRDAEKLGALLRRHPRRPIAIATGHVHRPMAGNLAGIPAYICGSICPANPVWFGSDTVPPADDPPSLMLYRFADGALVSHIIAV